MGKNIGYLVEDRPSASSASFCVFSNSERSTSRPSLWRFSSRLTFSARLAELAAFFFECSIWVSKATIRGV